MALEVLNMIRIRELSQRAELNERAGDIQESYGVKVPSYYEFCRSQGAQKATFKQKATRTAAFGIAGAVLGGVSVLAFGFGLAAGAIALAGATLMGAVAVKTNDRMPMLSEKPMLNAYKSNLDMLEARLIKNNEGVLMGAAKAVGGAAVGVAAGTVKGAASLAAGAVSATADLVADGAEAVADSAAESLQKAASKGKENFRDMVQTSRAELEQMETER